MKILVQMDDIFKINVNSDSTYKIMLEGCNLGHEIFFYTPDQLFFDSSHQKLKALISKVKLKNDPHNYCQIISQEIINLEQFDVILVRQDPPFDMSYLTTTYLLEKIKNKVLILNDPSEIRNNPEKMLVTKYSDLTPPTLIASDKNAIKDFYQRHQKIILKPLYSCGGDGVVLIEKNSQNLNSVIELLLSKYKAPLIAQQYLEAVKDGDKRLILIDGEFVGGICRVAQSDEIRSNLHIGGTATKFKPTARDLEICQIIGYELKKRNLFFVGIDIIGDYLTEINVTSPTGIVAVNQLNNCFVEEIFYQKLQQKIKNFNISLK